MIYNVSLVWCNVLMQVYVCLCMFVFIVRRVPSFEESTVKLRRPSDHIFKFYMVEGPEHLFCEGKCHLTYLCPIHMIIYFPTLHN
jgi:hypothetical protein